MQKYTLRNFVIATATLSITLGAMGCGEPTIEEEDARQYVDQWGPTVEDSLRSRAELAAASEALNTRFSSAAAAEERQVQRDEPPFGILVTQVYEERDFEPRLIDDEGLNERGQAIWETLQVVEDHQLDPEPYRLDAIAEALQNWEERIGSVADFDGLGATDDDLNNAVAWLVEQPQSAFELSADNHEELTTTLIDDDDLGARLRSALEDYQQKRASIAEAAAEVEYLLAAGVARYAREQRHFRIKEIFVHPRHWDFYNEPDVENSGRRPDPARGAFLAGRIWRDAAHLTEEIAEKNEAEILHQKIADTVAAVIDADAPRDELAAIPPQQPQYAGLVAEYRRYRDIVDNGGWQVVERTDNLRQGQSHPIISELKERLRVEGYFPDDVDIDDTYDEHLRSAIEDYQTTHQLQVTGRPHGVFWFSLNIPAERRLAQIALNIERWRETNVQHELDQYVFVNIPEFTIEMWKEQERIKRFATIVGDNELSVNPLTDEEEHSNRTPTPMAAYIDRVIFNPYWNVTQRIRAVRILPEVKKSIERKYALQFAQLLEEHQSAAAAQPTRPGPSLAMLGRGGGGSTTAAVQDEESADDAVEGQTEEQAAEPADEPAEQPPEPELTEEELAELEEKQRQERLNRAFDDWTYTQRVYNEDSERHEQRRFFHSSKLRQIEATVDGDDPEALEALHARFTYLDWETGEVDVESTDRDDIPSWYERNGYEVVHPGHAVWEYVRMLPGPENALGDVKIIFPNYDNIYLHDTPGRSLFSSTIRGFSHGCIRLQRPLQLSEALLELDGQNVNIQRILDDEDYHPIFLNRQVPVFLEYYTVTVDDEGRANFLADIYDYDDEELERLIQ